MKVELQGVPDLGDKGYYEFEDIIRFCLTAKDENKLRSLLRGYKFRNFQYGFGSSHFWMKNVYNGVQVLFIEF